MSLKIDFKNQSFYKKHPNLTPRNVYLASGRIMPKKEVDKASLEATVSAINELLAGV